MHVTLTEYHESTSCVWCEKQKEAVTISFADGFLRDLPLCWACLQKAIKVRTRQDDAAAHDCASGSLP